MKKSQHLSCLYFSFIILLLVKPGISAGQDTGSSDTSYYESFPDKLVASIYLSRKYAPFTISAPNTDQELDYKINSQLFLGIGASYRSLSLNLSYDFGFLNKEKGKGKTKGLDFQFHLYPHQWAIDLLGSFKKGYYLDPENNNGLNLSNYYLRPDIKRNIIGASAYRVPNSGRFSYRAAFIQNDWQKKSAGSLLYGGEAYYGSIKGDSAIVPNKAAAVFPQAGVNKINFFSIGPGIGYAYTLVIEKNFFVTGSVVGNLDVNFSTEEGSGSKSKKTALIPDAVYKAAIGYNSSSWSVSANIIGNALYVASQSSSKEYFLPTGNIRLCIARKIGL